MLVAIRFVLTAGLVATMCGEPAWADVYKYVDAAGNVYFTDAPLKGNRYRLEWHREARKLVRESQRNVLGSRQKSLPQGVSSGKSLPKQRSTYHGLVLANARRYRLSPGLLHAVIRAESAYNPAAVSSAGAQGLMQLMPGTAARYGVSDSFNPVENVRGGAAYLRDLLDMFDQDLRLALAGYNAGEGAVMKHGRQIPPYAETQGYVRKVLQYFRDEQPASIALTVR
ncbi:lytic transglycosylase domain-containing protein [Thiocystis violascens]|uniref:Soluble lytic murein transglycosylase-like protein n=1 Tax=Thiocystis violascens (strain ATCC 17096 / DSM 198 / 6111) TaxID=765911 RepID=I3Y7G5_THIV6|nr:lytic transglycosylase domain-containing protein [Thiocystis violascens]AFL72933.1 soluble lytic murein transglycosylase-like protein [Thiocystis violascens DSM 198]